MCQDGSAAWYSRGRAMAAGGPNPTGPPSRNRGFAKAAGAAGLLEWDSEFERWAGDFRPYDLRHTCASLMIRAHVGPADVAAQLGTSLELVFRTYAHSIEAMRGRPSTSVADAISATRTSGGSQCSEHVRNAFGDQPA